MAALYSLSPRLWGVVPVHDAAQLVAVDAVSHVHVRREKDESKRNERDRRNAITFVSEAAR